MNGEGTSEGSVKKATREPGGTDKGSDRALTLVILACLILVLALFGVRVKFFGRSDGDHPRNKQAATQISFFSQALDLFRVDNGRYPTTAEGLDALLKQPPGLTNWQQYLDSIPLDPWQHLYRYECPGQHLTNSFDLYSSGPDGRAGTDDDISNWKNLRR